MPTEQEKKDYYQVHMSIVGILDLNSVFTPKRTAILEGPNENGEIIELEVSSFPIIDKTPEEIISKTLANIINIVTNMQEKKTGKNASVEAERLWKLFNGDIK